MTTHLPSLSVIIPCYNGARFVAGAVESVLSQSASGVECIVVDDGSTDNSVELLRTTFGEAIRLVRQKNAGVAVARNTGFDAASGELIAWLDADDRLLPDTISRRREMFAADSAVDMLVGQVILWNIDDNSRAVSPERCGQDYLVTDLLNRTNLPHHNVITFRRRALERIGLHDPSFRTAEDYDLWIRAWAQLRWSFYEEPMAEQRIGSFLSLTRSETRFAMYEQVGRALRKNRDLVGTTAGGVVWERAYARYAADFALLYLANNYRSDARRWARHALTGGDGPTRSRGIRYSLEAMLPSAAYRAGRATLMRIGLLRSA